MNPIEIAGDTIGGDEPYVIAEAGMNHLNDLDLAKRFVEEAAQAGADAIKFQTFRRNDAMSEPGMRALDMADAYESGTDAELSRNDHRALQRHCEQENITFLSTPFSANSVRLLDDLDVPAIKIGSGELTDRNILSTAAATGRPLLISTGMADWHTIKEAYKFLDDRDVSFVFLYCISEYPTDPTAFEMGFFNEARDRFGVPIGFSDHSEGIEAAVLAMARGAAVVEKHFTIDRRLPGGDQDLSIEPEELAELTDYASLVAETGGKEKTVSEAEQAVSEWAHHSVVASKRIEAGAELTDDNLTTKRPATGISARRYHDILGRHATQEIDPDTVLTRDLVK
jgi:N-acetylneuraminate synthase/N,N'-diacetyllegionaminate synthase